MKKTIALVLLCMSLALILFARVQPLRSAELPYENEDRTDELICSPVPILPAAPAPTAKPTQKTMPEPSVLPLSSPDVTSAAAEALSPVPDSDYDSGSEPPQPVVTGQDIADLASQFVGYNYKYGGKDPEIGFDCSGFVYYCYGYYGIALNRTADAQAGNGVHVELDSLRPGDILCFYQSSSWIGHVGIYLGDGAYIHAEGSATGVVISDLEAHTGRIEARRIIDGE